MNFNNMYHLYAESWGDYMPYEVELTEQEYEKMKNFYNENPGDGAFKNEGSNEIYENYIDAR